MPAPMRIVYPLLWTAPGRKACQAQSLATTAALARHGCDVTLLMPQGRADPALSAADLRAWFEVEGDFAVVQRPSEWAGERLHRTLLWLRQVFRDPLLRSADLLYSRVPAMLAMGGRAPLPFATDHYRPWGDVYPAARPLIRRAASSHNCLGLVLHSQFAADAYRRIGVPDERIFVAHNGFDRPGEPIGKAAARRQLGLPTARAVAVYAGRINAMKGLDTVLALAERRPDVLFVLVGSEGEGEIEQAARQLPNMRIEPWARPGALQPWLSAADVLLIPPSREPLERFGNCVLPIKVFAYLAAGRPILAPAAQDTAELLVHGETAWLVPPDSPDAAAEGLDRLLGDAVLSEHLSAAAARVSERLTWDHRARAIAGFLETRLSERARTNPETAPRHTGLVAAESSPVLR